MKVSQLARCGLKQNSSDRKKDFPWEQKQWCGSGDSVLPAVGEDKDPISKIPVDPR